MTQVLTVADCAGLFSMTEEPIPGPYPRLARLVRRITGDVASRVAARRGNTSHDTIIRMWGGDRATEATLIKFAQGYGVDPNELLEAAEFSMRVPTLHRAPAEIVREGYNDYGDIPPEVMRAAERHADEMREAAERSYLEAYRLLRRESPGTVVGPPPDDNE